MTTVQVSAPDGIRALRFYPPRPLSDWISPDGEAARGREPDGTVLPYWVLDGVTECRNRGLPPMHAVIGEDIYPDGRRYLSFGVTRAYIEAVSDFRDTGSGLRWRCPVCGTGSAAKHAGCGL